MALNARHIPAGSIEEAATRAYDQIRARYGIGLDHNGAGELLTRFYGLRTLLHPLYEEALRDAEPPLEALLAADAYATAVAAKEALDNRFDRVPLNGYKISFPRQGDASLRERLLLNGLFEHHTRLTQQRPGAAVASAEQLVKALYTEAERLVQELPQALRTTVERAPVMVGERLYQGLSTRTGVVALESAPVVGKEVIGNDEAMSGLRRNLYRLGHFNPATMSNLFVEAGLPPAQTALLSGPTGTGKTLLTNVLYGEFIDWVARYNLAPVKEHRLGNDLKTSLINEGVENLRRHFNEMLSEPVIHLGLVDEFEGLAFRRSDLTNHPEEYKFQTEYMLGLSRLEGIKDRGNVFLTHITNFPGRLDPAMRARVSELAFAVYGPTTPEERGLLLRNELRQGVELGVVQVDDWEGLGRLAGELIADCSGRDLKNLALKTSQRIDRAFYDGTEPLLPPATSPQELQGMLAERAGRIDEEAIAEVIREYASLVDAERRRVRQERVGERAADIEIELAARRSVESGSRS